jgi:hypothetical protein
LGGASTKDVESYGASLTRTKVDIVDMKIPSTLTNTSQHLHPNMECDQPTLPVWVVEFPSSHDFLDTELTLEEAILEVMASI